MQQQQVTTAGIDNSPPTGHVQRTDEQVSEATENQRLPDI